MRNVREMVIQEGIPLRRLGKLVVIEKPQLGAGNSDCYARVYAEYFDQFTCLWREDCIALPAQSCRRN